MNLHQLSQILQITTKEILHGEVQTNRNSNENLMQYGQGRERKTD